VFELGQDSLSERTLGAIEFENRLRARKGLTNEA
jgi:hypothetical protein